MHIGERAPEFPQELAPTQEGNKKKGREQLFQLVENEVGIEPKKSFDQEERDSFLNMSQSIGYVSYVALTNADVRRVRSVAAEKKVGSAYLLERRPQSNAGIPIGEFDSAPLAARDPGDLKPQTVIESLAKFIAEQRARAQELAPFSPEEIECLGRGTGFRSSIDGKYHRFSESPSSLHFHVSRSDRREPVLGRAEEAEATLLGFGAAALESNDLATAILAFDALGLLDETEIVRKIQDELKRLRASDSPGQKRLYEEAVQVLRELKEKEKENEQQAPKN